MARERFIIGLDIGTSRTRLLVASRNEESGEVELVIKNEVKSEGIRRGTVVSVEKASNVFRELFYNSSQELGQRIDSVYINISGSHLFSVSSKGLVSVSRADQKISEEDVQRVLQAAQTINLSSNKEIFDVLPKWYVIDSVKGIKEPVGLEGVRLETEVLAVGGFSPYIQNTKKAVLSADLDILDMFPSPVAAANSVLTEKQKELGVALLDIGAGITSLAVFEENNLIHLAVLPMGSSNLTSDIAIGLKTDIDIAEQIKIEFGSCLFKGKDVKRKIDVGGDEPLVFTQKFLVKIIASRMEEIFEEANKELKKISKEKLLPAGVVLTGGGAKLHKLVDLAKTKFHLPVRMGEPKGILGVEGDTALSTVCGLVLSGVDSENREKGFDLGKKVISRFKKIFRIFLP